MRVTESSMIQTAAEAVNRARERAAASGAQVSGAPKVALPSDDPALWAEGARAQALAALSTSRGNVIGATVERLSQMDTSIGTVADALSRAKQLAVQLASGTYDATSRAAAASEVRSLRDSAIAQLNAQGTDGSYLFAGSQAGVAPFDAAGAYHGDGVLRNVELIPGQTGAADIAGTSFTAAAGPGAVDVIPLLDRLATDLDNNDSAAVSARMGDLDAAIAQIAAAHTTVGARLNEFNQADVARQSYEQRVTETHKRAVEADPIQAASEFSQDSVSLTAARQMAAQIVSIISSK